MLRWIVSRQKGEATRVKEQYRIARAHSYGIIRVFAGNGLPPIDKWWPMPDDEKLNMAANRSHDDKPLSGSDFIKAFGAAFGK